MPTIADYYIQIMPSAEGMSGELSKIMDEEAGSAGASASSSFGSKFSSGILKANLGAEAIKAVSKATVDLGKAAISAGSEWESSFAQVQTIMDTSQMSTEDMSSAIQNLSNEMGISATELSSTVYNAISATGDTANSVELAAQASKLATAGFTDTGSALSVLTTAMNAYGLSADEASNISDSLIQVQNLGVTTVSELASSMGKAIASASAYGVDLSNLESAYVSMTKSGINTAESTTYISSMLKELGSDGSTVSEILKQKTGKSFAELMNDGATLGDVLGVLSDSVDGDATALMNLWSSAEAGKASNAIISQGLEEFNSNLEQISSTAGTTENAYNTMADTLEHKTDVFKTLGTNLLSTIYEGMSGDLGDFVDLGNEALSALSEGFSSGGVSGLMSALGDVLSNLVTEIVKKLPDIVNAGSELLGSLAEGIITNLPTLATAAMDIISNLANGLAQNLPTLIPTITEILLQVTTVLIENLPTIIDAGMQLFQGLVEGLVQAIPVIVDALPGLIDTIISTLIESMPLIMDGALTMFMAIVDALPDIISAITEALPQIIDSIVSFLTGDGLPQILEGAITMLMGIVEAIPSIISAIASNLPTIITTVITGLVGALPQILDAAITMLNGIIEAIPEIISSLASNIPTIIDAIVESLSAGLSAIKSVGANLISGLWNGISDKAQWLYGQITSLGNTVVSKVKSLFGIHSPSTVFAEIGGYLAEGLGVGWSDEIEDVKNDMNKDLTFKGSLETNYSTTPSSNNALVGTSFTMYETIQLGDTKLKDIISKYTIQQVGNETRAVRVAQGGMY